MKFMETDQNELAILNSSFLCGWTVKELSGCSAVSKIIIEIR